MRIDQGRREQAALGIELRDVIRSIDPDGGGRRNGDDAIALGADVLQRDVGAGGRMDARIPDEQARLGSLPRPWSRRS
jgi:hypothetical protein